MNNPRTTILLLSLTVLAACSTPQPAPKAQALEVTPVSRVTKYADPEVNEAASAYVALYKTTIERSVQERRYMGDLAYRHLSAEACFESRANRLLDHKVSVQEREALVLTQVSAEKLKHYKELAKGYFPRINGMELFTCDRAGLRVAQNTAKY
ncbi:MAG: hypothetical protein R3E56_08485 [Burkholderiaceae bacterium]